MRKSFLRSLTVTFLIVSLVPPQSAVAWGNSGHEAVAYVAWQRLKDRQDIKDKIWALLQQVPTRTSPTQKVVAGFKEWSQNLPSGLSSDQRQMYVFMRAATWPDSMKHVGFEDSDTVPANHDEATSNIGFTDKFSHGYWHFVDKPTGTAADSTPPDVPRNCWIRKPRQSPVPPTPVTEIPDTPPVNTITEINDLSAALASSEPSLLKAYDMIWLEHLVGDIHQPLHGIVRYVNGIGDEGGNCVAISVPADLRDHFTSSSESSRPPAELHAFWDDLPGIGGPMDTPQAAGYAATLPAADRTQAAISDPSIWAQESYDMAIKDAYANPIGPELGSPQAYVITTDYYNRAASDAQARIALAGARLACLLTKALQEKTLSAQGSCPD